MNEQLIFERLRELGDAELQQLAEAGGRVAEMATALLESRRRGRKLWSELLLDDETAAALRAINGPEFNKEKKL